MFNLLILSLMDAVQPEPLSTRAHQGHALSIGFGLLLLGIAGFGLLGAPRLPAIGWVGPYCAGAHRACTSSACASSSRTNSTGGRARRRRSPRSCSMRRSRCARRLLHYAGAAVLVVGAALWLPRLGAELARQTGLGEAFVGSLFIADHDVAARDRRVARRRAHRRDRSRHRQRPRQQSVQPADSRARRRVLPAGTAAGRGRPEPRRRLSSRS